MAVFFAALTILPILTLALMVWRRRYAWVARLLGIYIFAIGCSLAWAIVLFPEEPIGMVTAAWGPVWVVTGLLNAALFGLWVALASILAGLVITIFGIGPIASWPQALFALVLGVALGGTGLFAESQAQDRRIARAADAMGAEVTGARGLLASIRAELDLDPNFDPHAHLILDSVTHLWSYRYGAFLPVGLVRD